MVEYHFIIVLLRDYHSQQRVSGLGLWQHCAELLHSVSIEITHDLTQVHLGIEPEKGLVELESVGVAVFIVGDIHFKDLWCEFRFQLHQEMFDPQP